MRDAPTIRGVRLGIALTLFAVLPAQAQTTIDAAKITCRQLILLKVASPDIIVTWLSGYYHGKQGNTTIDVEQLKDQPQKLTNYCLYEGRQETLMEAVEHMLSSGK
jgi:acid stress chaperone HdeB